MMNTSVRKTQERYAKNTSKPNKQSNQNVSAGAYAAKYEVLSPHFFLIYFKWEERFKIFTPKPDKWAPRNSGRVTKKAAKAFVKQCNFVGRWQDLFLHWDGTPLFDAPVIVLGFCFWCWTISRCTIFMQVLVKNWLVDAEKTEVAHLWAAVNVWLKYRSCLVGTWNTV